MDALDTVGIDLNDIENNASAAWAQMHKSLTDDSNEIFTLATVLHNLSWSTLIPGLALGILLALFLALLIYGLALRDPRFAKYGLLRLMSFVVKGTVWDIQLDKGAQGRGCTPKRRSVVAFLSRYLGRGNKESQGSSLGLKALAIELFMVRAVFRGLRDKQFYLERLSTTVDAARTAGRQIDLSTLWQKTPSGPSGAFTSFLDKQTAIDAERRVASCRTRSEYDQLLETKTLLVAIGVCTATTPFAHLDAEGFVHAAVERSRDAMGTARFVPCLFTSNDTSQSAPPHVASAPSPPVHIVNPTSKNLMALCSQVASSRACRWTHAVVYVQAPLRARPLGWLATAAASATGEKDKATLEVEFLADSAAAATPIRDDCTAWVDLGQFLVALSDALVDSAALVDLTARVLDTQRIGSSAALRAVRTRPKWPDRAERAAVFGSSLNLAMILEGSFNSNGARDSCSFLLHRGEKAPCAISRFTANSANDPTLGTSPSPTDVLELTPKEQVALAPPPELLKPVPAASAIRTSITTALSQCTSVSTVIVAVPWMEREHEEGCTGNIGSSYIFSGALPDAGERCSDGSSIELKKSSVSPTVGALLTGVLMVSNESSEGVVTRGLMEATEQGLNGNYGPGGVSFQLKSSRARDDAAVISSFAKQQEEPLCGSAGSATIAATAAAACVKRLSKEESLWDQIKRGSQLLCRPKTRLSDLIFFLSFFPQLPSIDVIRHCATTDQVIFSRPILVPAGPAVTGLWPLEFESANATHIPRQPNNNLAASCWKALETLLLSRSCGSGSDVSAFKQPNGGVCEACDAVCSKDVFVVLAAKCVDFEQVENTNNALWKTNGCTPNDGPQSQGLTPESNTWMHLSSKPSSFTDKFSSSFFFTRNRSFGLNAAVHDMCSAHQDLLETFTNGVCIFNLYELLAGSLSELQCRSASFKLPYGSLNGVTKESSPSSSSLNKQNKETECHLKENSASLFVTFVTLLLDLVGAGGCGAPRTAREAQDVLLRISENCAALVVILGVEAALRDYYGSAETIVSNDELNLTNTSRERVDGESSSLVDALGFLHFLTSTFAPLTQKETDCNRIKIQTRFVLVCDKVINISSANSESKNTHVSEENDKNVNELVHKHVSGLDSADVSKKDNSKDASEADYNTQLIQTLHFSMLSSTLSKTVQFRFLAVGVPARDELSFISDNAASYAIKSSLTNVKDTFTNERDLSVFVQREISCLFCNLMRSCGDNSANSEGGDNRTNILRFSLPLELNENERRLVAAFARFLAIRKLFIINNAGICHTQETLTQNPSTLSNGDNCLNNCSDENKVKNVLSNSYTTESYINKVKIAGKKMQSKKQVNFEDIFMDFLASEETDFFSFISDSSQMILCSLYVSFKLLKFNTKTRDIHLIPISILFSIYYHLSTFECGGSLLKLFRKDSENKPFQQRIQPYSFFILNRHWRSFIYGLEDLFSLGFIDGGCCSSAASNVFQYPLLDCIFTSPPLQAQESFRAATEELSGLPQTPAGRLSDAERFAAVAVHSALMTLLSRISKKQWHSEKCASLVEAVAGSKRVEGKDRVLFWSRMLNLVMFNRECEGGLRTLQTPDSFSTFFSETSLYILLYASAQALISAVEEQARSIKKSICAQNDKEEDNTTLNAPSHFDISERIVTDFTVILSTEICTSEFLTTSLQYISARNLVNLFGRASRALCTLSCYDPHDGPNHPPPLSYLAAVRAAGYAKVLTYAAAANLKCSAADIYLDCAFPPHELWSHLFALTGLLEGNIQEEGYLFEGVSDAHDLPLPRSYPNVEEYHLSDPGGVVEARETDAPEAVIAKENDATKRKESNTLNSGREDSRLYLIRLRQPSAWMRWKHSGNVNKSDLKPVSPLGHCSNAPGEKCQWISFDPFCPFIARKKYHKCLFMRLYNSVSFDDLPGNQQEWLQSDEKAVKAKTKYSATVKCLRDAQPASLPEGAEPGATLLGISDEIVALHPACASPLDRFNLTSSKDTSINNNCSVNQDITNYYNNADSIINNNCKNLKCLCCPFVGIHGKFNGFFPWDSKFLIESLRDEKNKTESLAINPTSCKENDETNSNIVDQNKEACCCATSTIAVNNGYDSSVTSLAFIDKHKLFVGHNNGDVRVLDAFTGKELNFCIGVHLGSAVSRILPYGRSYDNMNKNVYYNSFLATLEQNNEKFVEEDASCESSTVAEKDNKEPQSDSLLRKGTRSVITASETNHVILVWDSPLLRNCTRVNRLDRNLMVPLNDPSARCFVVVLGYCGVSTLRLAACGTLDDYEVEDAAIGRQQGGANIVLLQYGFPAETSAGGSALDDRFNPHIHVDRNGTLTRYCTSLTVPPTYAITAATVAPLGIAGRARLAIAVGRVDDNNTVKNNVVLQFDVVKN